ncbi:helix-turn-helix transcriptional regulator [Algisphaera agarilytica]|uniref:helix-turn-helix transcriptional regulator n=1 Tax=Algisphaera agarilytica TaxID=1385975 RepID=UPI001C889A4F|nr:helix-turn-helix transcriptional regulator [Algisphaera agarilytica]
MSELNLDQWNQVHRATQEVARVAEVDDFHQHAIGAVKMLMSHTLISSELHDLSLMQLVSSAQTREDDEFQSRMPDFADHLHEHPCVEAALNTRSLNIMGVLDKMSSRDFEKLGLYNEFYRYVDIRDQIIIARSQGFPSLLALAISRDKQFSPSERQMLELFAPSLANAHTTWQAIRRAKGHHAWALGALEHLNCGALHVSTDGRILDQNPLAKRLIEDYWPGRNYGDRLPQALHAWLKVSTQDPLNKRHPLVRQSPAGTVSFRLAQDIASDDWLILGRENPAVTDLTPLLELGLTEKQAEVINVARHGLTYSQIAEQLGKSAGTVRKQMEQIMAKLDVHDKAAAVAKATQALNTPGL